jgi:hypothetical protein
MTDQQGSKLPAGRFMDAVAEALVEADTTIDVLGETMAAFGYDLDELRFQLFMQRLANTLGEYAGASRTGAGSAG